MKRYKKKPVVVEALQLRWDTWSEMCDHARVGRLSESADSQGCIDEGNKIGLDVRTLTGIVHACENDWIIKSVKGELYPCKPDIFEETYELLEEKGKA